MTVICHGIDLMDLEKFCLLAKIPDSDFLTRCFTANELEIAGTSTDANQHLAGKFSAKEAIAKALGTGFDGEITPKEIEILNDPQGAPTLQLSGAASSVARSLKIERWLISISHSDSAVIASVIGLSI